MQLQALAGLVREVTKSSGKRRFTNLGEDVETLTEACYRSVLWHDEVLTSPPYNNLMPTFSLALGLGHTARYELVCGVFDE